MPSVVAGALGLSGASSILGGFGASRAASRQADASQQQLDLQRFIFEQQRDLLDPFRQVGVDSLEELRALATPRGEADFYSDYFGSPEFAALSNQARGQQLAAAEATGGLGSTSTQNQLARIAPELGSQALARRTNLLGNLANIGLSGAGSQAAFAGQFGSLGSQTLGNLGNIRAGQAQIPFQVGGQLLDQTSSLLLGGGKF